MFGTYFAKDAAVVHTALNTSHAQVSQTYEHVKKSTEEFFTYKSISHKTVNVISAGDQIVEQGLSSYLSLINNIGEGIITVAYEIPQIAKKITVENAKTTSED